MRELRLQRGNHLGRLVLCQRGPRQVCLGSEIPELQRRRGFSTGAIRPGVDAVVLRLPAPSEAMWPAEAFDTPVQCAGTPWPCPLSPLDAFAHALADFLTTVCAPPARDARGFRDGAENFASTPDGSGSPGDRERKRTAHQ